jgi:hypothetical protein
MLVELFFSDFYYDKLSFSMYSYAQKGWDIGVCGPGTAKEIGSSAHQSDVCIYNQYSEFTIFLYDFFTTARLY